MNSFIALLVTHIFFFFLHDMKLAYKFGMVLDFIM